MSDIRSMVAEYLGIPTQHGDEWTIMCPSPDHVDHRPSASIYVGEPASRLKAGQVVPRLPGMWVCYSCHRSGRISNDAIENYTPSTDRNLQVLDDALLELENDRHVYPESWLDLFEYPGGVHPYWLSRFAEETCLVHRLGYDYEREAGTYPFRSPSGELLGVVLRSFDTEATGWKYRYPRGIDKSALLYGYHEAAQRGPDAVVLVEGALDAVAVWEAGLGPTVMPLAIYGSRISGEQVRLINRLNPGEVIFAFDNDSAGVDATQHATGAGLSCFHQRVVSLPPGTKDIAELPVDERRRALATSQLI